MRPSSQGPFSAISLYLRPGPISGCRLNHAAYVPRGSCTIRPAVLPYGMADSTLGRLYAIWFHRVHARGPLEVCAI